MDVHCCMSGEAVVIHDDTVNRTTNGKGRVARLTLAQLKELEIEGGERIPTLSEALDTIGPDVTCFLEIKRANAAKAVKREIEERIKAGWPPRSLWLISFERAVLEELLGEAPVFPVGLCVQRWGRKNIEAAAAQGMHAVIPSFKLLSKARVNQAHALGLELFAWTVNEPQDIRRVKALKIDGIMSDYPERLA